MDKRFAPRFIVKLPCTAGNFAHDFGVRMQVGINLGGAVGK